MARIIELRDMELLGQVAKLYCEIFQEEPWGEILKPLEVVRVMDKQFNKPKATAFVAIEGRNKVIGFAWMHQIFREDLKPDTRYSPELKFLFDEEKNVFYLRETGVKKDMRGQGIGPELIQQLLSKGKEKGADVVVLSTNSKATAMVRTISKIGFVNTGIVRPPENLHRTYWTLELRD